MIYFFLALMAGIGVFIVWAGVKELKGIDRALDKEFGEDRPRDWFD